MRLLALSFVLLSFAGCLDNGDSPPGNAPEGAGYEWPAPDWAKAAFGGVEVDHFSPEYFQDKTTPNFEILGWDPMISGYHGTTSGTTLCGGAGTRADGQRLAASHGFSNDAALMVHDVTDAANPIFLGELILPRTGVYDATMTQDGRWALLAAKAVGDQPDTGTATYRDRLQWRDACGQTFEGPLDELPYGNGVVLVDLANPRVPTVADWKAVPGAGVHSVDARLIDGTYYAMGSTVGITTGASVFQFFQIQEAAGLGQLIPTGIYNGVVRQNVDGAPVGLDTNVLYTNLHTDALFHKHPITGQVLAYLSDWDGGLIVVDMATGGSIGIGQWSDVDPNLGTEMTGAIHSAFALDHLIDDRHYTFAGQEVIGRPADRPTGQIVMLDTTDPTRPTPVARWTLPVDPPEVDGAPYWPVPIAYSTHYFVVHNNTLFTSMYHGGVWAADIRSQHWPELPTTGVFLPANESPEPPTLGRNSYGGLFYLTPMVSDVMVFDDGTLVSWDAPSGIYTYKFTEDDPRVEPVAPWVVDRWI